MSGPKSNYIISKMSTVLVIDFDGKDLKQEEDKINKKVERKVKEIVDQLKISHNKFEDPDFGPRPDDEYGAIALYGGKAPEPAGSKYPAPETLRWERPLYTDDKFNTDGDKEEKGNDDEEEDEDEEDEFAFGGGRNDEKEVFCENGRLFIDGSSSGDVIQGQLGDCWFLSALAVLGADDNLLENCFWRREEFREYGLYVLRFYKDCSLFFVIIDDRLPVKDKDGRLIFAGGKDPNELWVPLIEKAYAKLHGCYKALIGGYTHYGLADMTGFSPRLVVMREGYLGFSQKYEPNDLWQLLSRYASKDWKCMMGCSIQPAPNDKRKVEADAGQGLHMGHAYSFLALGEIKEKKTGQMVKLMKLRNPWGRGEWEGRFSDNSPERKENEEEIARIFDKQVKKVEHSVINHADGTFFMPYEDWLQHFTSLFVAINFPKTWVGRRVGGFWSGEQGGNRDMGTWITNPKFKLRLETTTDENSRNKNNNSPIYKSVFVGLYIKDSRLTMGFDYYKDPLYATPLTFDIVTASELSGANATQKTIPKAVRFYPLPPNQTSYEPCLQPPYNFGATQVEVFLQPNEDYYIIPSLYKRNQAGEFYLTVYADCDKLQLDGSSLVSETHRPMEVADGKVKLKMSVAQYNEKKESLRDRIVSEAKRMNISYVQIRNLLLNNNQESVSRSIFKRRMMDAGFMLTDFPDDDFVVLDGDTGQIKINDFLEFIAKGMSFEEGVTNLGPPPSKPVDDLLFKAIDLSGELSVHINSARGLRDASAWFKNIPSATPVLTNDTNIAAKNSGISETTNANSSNVTNSGRPRTLITYDVEKAAQARLKAIKERAVPLSLTRADDFNNNNSNNNTGNSSYSSALTTPATPGTTLLTTPRDKGLSVQTQFADVMPSSVPTSPEKNMIHSLQALSKSNNNNNKAMTVVSQMSMTQKDLVSRAGAGAAVKLHSDALLQRAEVTRTKNLSLLRANGRSATGNNNTAGNDISNNNKNKKKEEEITIMRAKSTATAGKKGKRDIRQHVDIMQWLGLSLDLLNASSQKGHAAGKNIPSRPPMLKMTGNDNNTAVSDAKTSLMEPISTNSVASFSIKPPSATLTTITNTESNNMNSVPNKGRPYDIWDLLIDNVYTICTSRPANARTQRHRTFMEMKRKPIRSEQLLLLEDVPTPLPMPSKSNTSNANNATSVKGNNMYMAGTPRTKLISRGVASVKGAHVSKSQTKQTIVEARDKLLQFKQSMGKTYHEIYRRLVSITTTSYEEMSGERATKAQVSLSANSPAYLKKLFEKFDTNGNGLISKEEFRLAMQDLNVELSREDCDIFFNRFTGSVPGNINWKEFVDFFQHEIAGATMKTMSGSGATGSSAGNSNGFGNSMNMDKVGLDLNLVHALTDLKRVVKEAVQRMQQQRLTSIDAYLEANRMQTNGASSTAAAAMNSARLHPSTVSNNANNNVNSSVNGLIRAKKYFSDENVKIPPNAIFQTLTMSQVKSNTMNLQALGLLNITEVMMARISRIFDFSVTNIMEFILSEKDNGAPVSNKPETPAPPNGSNNTGPVTADHIENTSDLSIILNEFDDLLTKELLARGGSFTFSKPSNATATAAASNAPAAASNVDNKKAVISTPAKSFKSPSGNANVPPLPLASNSTTVSNTSPVPPLTAATVTAPLDLMDPPHSTTAKIWSTFAPTLDALSPFDIIVRYMFSLLQECRQFVEKEIPLISPRAVKDPMVRSIERKATMPSATLATAATPTENVNNNSSVLIGKKLFFRGMDVSVLVRIVVDAMVYSSWNRLPAQFVGVVSGHVAGMASVSGGLGAGVATGAAGVAGGGQGLLSGMGGSVTVGPGSGMSGSGSGSGSSSGSGGLGSVGSSSGGSGASLALVGYLSYSGLDAYIRNNRIAYIERKLQYLIHLEHDRNKTATFFLVHVYFSSEGDEVVIVADDPLSGEVHKLQVQEQVKHMPWGDSLKALFLQSKALENAMQVANKLLPYPHRTFDQDSLYLYNPVDTPLEDTAISQMVSRLKLVRSQATNTSQLILAEDPLLVTQIKQLMDVSAKSLPFFYLVNDLFLSFEVDEMAIKSVDELQELENPNYNNGKGSSTKLIKNTTGNSNTSNESKATTHPPSVRSVVFGSIRRQKALCTFLTQVNSSLKVVLTTYNSTLRETFAWEEMLAHLSNQRNPFVTVQLLPKYIPPEQYLYSPPDENLSLKKAAFTGDDEDDSDDEPEPPSEGMDETIVLPKHKSWQRSHIDYDGAPRPIWDKTFAFNFHAPKMTSCEVHAREVVKMKVDSVTKYVMILIREGQRLKNVAGRSSADTKVGPTVKEDKENFLFLTLYDPRSATEYQVGVKPQSRLFAHLYYDRIPVTGNNRNNNNNAGLRPADYHNIDVLREKVNEAAEKEDIFVGPAITPRIQLSVFNHKDEKMKELIGQSQVSVSAVLSGSGISDRVWVKLVNMVEKPTAGTNANNGKGLPSGEMKLTEEPAGEIEVELRFRRSIEMIGELKARQNNNGAQQKRSKSQRFNLTSGDETGNETEETSQKKVTMASNGNNTSNKQMKELTQQLLATEEKLKRVETEYAKLHSNKSDPSNAASDSTAASDKDINAAAKLEAYVQQLEKEKEALLAEKQAVDTEHEKLQRENAAVLTELHKLEEQVQTSSATVSNNTTTPRGKLSDAKTLAEVQELKMTNQQLQEQEKQAKEAMEDLRLQLQKMKEEHAKTVQEIYRLQDTAKSTSNGSTVNMIHTHVDGQDVTSTAAFSAIPAVELNHVLQILLSRYEKKMKLLSGGTGNIVSSGNITAAPVLDTLQRLLHSFANPEGMITQRELMIAFSELMIDVNTEFVVKIITDVGPDSRKMVQVHSVMDYLKRELTQILKRHKQSIRMSQESSLLTAAHKAVSSVEENASPEKQRPASAVVQGSGKAAVAAMKSNLNNNNSTANAEESKKNPKLLRSQSAKPASASAPAAANNIEEVNDKHDEEDEDHHGAIVDWNTQPLPSNWERKFHAPANRFVYIDHEHHKTQWHHPLDPSGGNHSSTRHHHNNNNNQPVKPSGVKSTNSNNNSNNSERLVRTVEIPRAIANDSSSKNKNNSANNNKDNLNRTYPGPAGVESKK